MTSAVFSFDAVSKSFGQRRVLDELSFDVQPGEIVGILGPNGSGKTTAMRILTGLERADAGAALVSAVPYRLLDNPGRKVGVLLDPSWLDGRLRCRDAIQLAAVGCGRRLQKGQSEVELERLGLGGKANVPISKLSLGMRQRLALGVALLPRPEALVLDEPVNGLDVEGILWLRRELSHFAAAGGGVLISSHLLTEMQQVATRVVVLDRGRLIASNSLERNPESLIGTSCQVLTGASTFRDHLDAMKIVVGLQEDEYFLLPQSAPEDVFRLACGAGVVLSDLRLLIPSLEETYLPLIQDRAREKGGMG